MFSIRILAEKPLVFFLCLLKGERPWRPVGHPICVLGLASFRWSLGGIANDRHANVQCTREAVLSASFGSDSCERAVPNRECLHVVNVLFGLMILKQKTDLKQQKCHKALSWVTEGIALGTWCKCWVSVMKLDTWQWQSPSKAVSMLSSAEAGKDKVGKNRVISCLEWHKLLLASLPAAGSAHPDPLDHVFRFIFLKNTKLLNANKPSPHSLFLQNSPQSTLAAWSPMAHMVLPLLLHGLAPSPSRACPSILWTWSHSTFPRVCSTSPAPGNSMKEQKDEYARATPTTESSFWRVTV